MRLLTLIFLLVIMGNFLYAQEILTLKDAVNIALQNSFDIKIAKNNIAITTINNHQSIAGALPTISATVNDQESIVNINQELNTGTKISRNGATSNNLNTSVVGSMILYNGFRIKTTKKRLEELQKLSEQQLNTQIQNTIAAVHVGYYDVVRQNYFIKTIQKNIEVAQQRLTIIKVRKEIGLANNADIFQAEIDVNARLQDLNAQQLQLEQSKTNLLNILDIKLDSNILIKDTIIVSSNLKLYDVMLALQQNPQILTATQQIKINELIEKETNALRQPTLRANAGINFNRNQATGGQLLLNQSYGPFVGVNLALPLYNGGVIKRQEQVAKLNTTNSKLQQQSFLNELQTLAARAFQTYNNNLHQLELQQKTFNLSNELVKLTVQRFELSQATIIELREAQRSYEDAAFRLISISYAAKLGEIELNRLAGVLAF